ncbi:MAG: BamA/TamA family outer membrane protein [Prevotella sp.]|nr:BamA/TamA family outer membrane protein [Prevotella sp.]
MLLCVVLWSCSSTRHVPAGEYLLDKVSINIEDSTKDLSEQEMMLYLRQIPNHKMLWTTKLRLNIYNMSGKDTTKWWNRWIRKIGEPPVIYDNALTLNSAAQLRLAMVNKGYLEAEVEVDTILDSVKKKANVGYRLKPGGVHRVKSINYEFPNDTLRDIVMMDSMHFTIKDGDPLDRSLLEKQQSIITQYLRNRGYYTFTKEYVTFVADTTEGSYDVDLTMRVSNPPSSPGLSAERLSHLRHVLRKVVYVTDYDPSKMDNLTRIQAEDTVEFRGITILYGKDKYLRPSVLYDNCFLEPGAIYSEVNVNRTYKALSRLSILKFTNIRFVPIGVSDDIQFMDAYILLTPGKSQSVSFELEGTHSEGDLGLAAAVTYTHRNIGKGSETLSAKFRGAYESVSGNLDGLIHNRYMEYSTEVGLIFPKFKAPLLKESFKRRIQAQTEFNISMNYQERPEYTRVIGTMGWSYKWLERYSRNRHVLTPIDINYVYLPESTNDFLNQIAPDNPLLRYSYEDHFIMRMGYQFYHSNKRREHLWTRGMQKDIYTLRFNGEIAGNLLFLINSIFTHRKNFHENPYKVFGIRYSQYFKVEGDVSYVHYFDHRNSLALHVGMGVGVPYGNSYVLPFEKRFYGGGANGVRGWSVRTLGPGSYRGGRLVSDFIYQCGDIKLLMNAEMRSKLFWVVEGAFFVDAGNIWTIRNYPEQPGGVFLFDKFYKQIAAAYGVGIRLDFNYFLLRFDLGMKAHNPAEGAEPWPIIHPKWGRDSSFHFSIGYPF